MKNDKKAGLVIVAAIAVLAIICCTVLVVKCCFSDKKDDEIKLDPIQKEMPAKTNETIAPAETQKPQETTTPNENPDINTVPDSEEAPANRNAQIQTCMEAMNKIFAKSGFDYTKIHYDSSNRCIRVLLVKNGLTDSVESALNRGIKPSQWDEIITSFKSIYKYYCDIADSQNCSDIHITFDLLNDKSTDHTLLRIEDGIMTYSVFDQ